MSDIDTKKPERRRSDAPQGRKRFRSIVFSRLTRLILLANLLGLAILTVGVFALGEMRQGLIQARIESLRTQGELIASVLSEGATEEAFAPRLDADAARAILRSLYVPPGVRVRLFANDGMVVTDSYLLSDEVVARPLPPPEETLNPQIAFDADELPPPEGLMTLDEEFSRALLGRIVENQRVHPDGERLVSVSIPVRRVQAVLGVVTIEAGGVDAIIAAERRALAPFLLVAFLVTIASSMLITVFIARPIRRLSIAADLVRKEGPRRAHIPDLSSRRDEIGDLSVTLDAMTTAIANRIDTIEAFAADVAHEVKNPLTSIRSALETLPRVQDDERRERLLGVMQHDVGRIDRLITDISNASRLDAELARARAEPMDLARLLTEMAQLYADIRRPGEPELVFEGAPRELLVHGAEASLGQVFRNLIDNAKTFSPENGRVRLTLAPEPTAGGGRPGARVTVDDDGPGVPPDNLEKVFDRFYTERPKGAAFGSHSGLGLAIARQIVEAHGGRVWAENRLDASGDAAGARFVVVLPFRQR